MSEISRRKFLKGAGAIALGIGIMSREHTPAQAARLPGAAAQPPAAVAFETPPEPALVLLSRATFGPKPGQLEAVRAQGPAAWIDRQLHPETIDDSGLDDRLAAFTTLTMSIAELVEGFPPNGTPGPRQVIQELQQAALLRAVSSERQLLEVMVDFWTNHFNIHILKGQCKLLKTVDDREVIRKHALGRFQDLLTASAQSPAMLEYLDNKSNVKGVPNENYARELLELHTLGVEGGYSQADVLEVARCLTGWTYRVRGSNPGFFFDRNKHDTGAKTVLGHVIPANGGINDGLRVIDILAQHPSTARFLATKLVRRFVADDPPAALVERVASAFARTHGDMRATLEVLLKAPAFAASFGQKTKRPFEMHVAALRGLDASTDGQRPILAQLNLMGQMPYMRPTPDGYPDTAEAWINTDGLLHRWNYSLAVVEGRIRGTRADMRTPTVEANPRTAGELVDLWSDRLLHRPLAAADREQLVQYVSDGKPAQFRLTERVLNVKTPELVALLLNSPHFQRR